MPQRVDFDRPETWTAHTPAVFIYAAVHRMLNQLNAVQFLIDTVSDPVVKTAIRDSNSNMLEDMDVDELVSDAAEMCEGMIKMLRGLHDYAAAIEVREIQDTPPPSDSAP